MSSPMPAAELDLDRFLADVVSRIAEATRHAAVHARPGSGRLDEATRLERAIDDLVAGGGKLLRPRVVALGHRAVGGTNADHGLLVRLGSAIELLHVFGLLQDDVMDEAMTRRGRPAAHRALAAAVADPAEGTRFGESLAVLAGDLAFALAGRELRGLPGPVLDAWDDMVIELVQGQRLDLVYAADHQLDTDGAHWVAMAKSGAYTVARPLELGARLAHPDRRPPEWLRSFGTHLGMAFALVDDVLGLWGDPAATGKPVGDDLRQGKPTTVLAIADDLVGGRVGAALRAAAGPLDPTTTCELLALFEEAGVRDAVDRRLAEHVAAARSQLVHAGPSARPPLHDLVDVVATRTS